MSDRQEEHATTDLMHLNGSTALLLHVRATPATAPASAASHVSGKEVTT
jgi:hypothetical protein